MQYFLPGSTVWQHISAIMARRRILLCILLCSVCGSYAYGQAMPGVVWDEPFPPTVSDLVEIHQAGVQAIRLPILEDDALLYTADTLGLHLFQDLPVLHLPAGVLLDTLEYAKNWLNRARWMSLRFASAQRFGVSTKSDTSTPYACGYFESLSEWAPELILYYISAFPIQEQCSSHVDLVLLDTRGASDFEEIIGSWQHATPIGLAGLGKRVATDAYGLYQEDSPQSQARFLEDHLPSLLGNGSLTVVFVYRWRDPPSSLFQWGLIDGMGRKRPAYEVVQGIYTGTQYIFAFDWGEPPRQVMLWPVGYRVIQSGGSMPWPLILAWTSLMLIVFLSMWYRRFPAVMWNYIMNLYPHRETLYRESALLGSVSFVYVIAQGLLVAGVALILLEAYRNLQVIEAITELLSPSVRDQIFNLVSKPGLLILVVVAIYLMWNLIFSLFGAWRARQPEGIPVENFFVINAMNHTSFWMMVPMVMVAPALDPKPFQILAHILAFTWVFLSIYCNIRSARNFSALSRSRYVHSTKLSLYSVPVLLFILGIVLLCLPGTREYIAFWWHLSFRS